MTQIGPYSPGPITDANTKATLISTKICNVNQISNRHKLLVAWEAEVVINRSSDSLSLITRTLLLMSRQGQPSDSDNVVVS